MLNLARKSLLITMIICFAAMVTGLTLMLHLFSIEHPEEHNCEQCPICQQIFINPAKVIIPDELAVIHEDIVLYQVDSIFNTPVIIEETPSYIPRAPPSISLRSV